LRSEIAGLGQAIANSERAGNIIATAEGALNEVAAMLVNIQDLVVEAANTGGMSEDEIAANQLQVDSAVESITRIANTTTFSGLNLLNGNMSYLTSGVDETAIKDLHVHAVQFGTNDYVPVNVQGVVSAQKAELRFENSQITDNVTIQVQGVDGVKDFSFSSGIHASAILFAVNTVSDATGVEASFITSANPDSGISFQSAGYGSKAFVLVKALQTGTSFDVVNVAGASAQSDEGRDIQAVVNGILAQGDGLKLAVQSLGLDVEMLLDETFGTGNSSFAITGGGAKFQLGPAVSSNQQINIGIESVDASSLGNSQYGYLSQVRTGGEYSLITGNARSASDIIHEAVRQVAVLRGRLGAFEKNTLQSNINSLQIALENVTASESQIRDADFAHETSQLTRAQILTQAGTSVLAVANTTPQSVLALLGR